MTAFLGAAMAIAVGGTLWAEARQPLRRRLWKMTAASGFLAVALSGGALDSRFGTIMLAGLVLAWVGDLALTFGQRTAFLTGLGSFLGAHVAYSVAFALPEDGGFYERSLDPGNALAALVVVAMAGAWIGRRLLPQVTKDLRRPVVAYILVISTMVALAAGHTVACAATCEPSDTAPLAILTAGWDWRIITGAVLFYVSDLAVARDRFVAPGIVNRMWGLPAYFAAQFLLAWSAGGPLP